MKWTNVIIYTTVATIFGTKVSYADSTSPQKPFDPTTINICKINPSLCDDIPTGLQIIYEDKS